MIKLCIFDLDGTLLNTLGTITAHLNCNLTEKGLDPITVDECRRFIGNGAAKLVERAVGKSGVFDADIVNGVLSKYNEDYNNDPLPNTKPYDGVTELISELSSAGCKLAVLTNKPEPTAIQLVSHFFGDAFSAVKGGKGGRSLKPDPSTALEIAMELDAKPSECVFIGDTSVDIMTGKNMGAAFAVGLLWGFRDSDDLVGADLITDSTDEILSFLRERSG